MPFFRMDPETWDEYMSELTPEQLEKMDEKRPSGEFEYHPSTARFSPEDLGPVAREFLAVLIAVGITAFRVQYDGGGDEGFAYPEALLVGEDVRPVSEVLREVATAQVQASIRTAVQNNPRWPLDWYTSATPSEIAS
jgi:hypothetical protein